MISLGRAQLANQQCQQQWPISHNATPSQSQSQSPSTAAPLVIPRDSCGGRAHWGAESRCGMIGAHTHSAVAPSLRCLHEYLCFCTDSICCCRFAHPLCCHCAASTPMQQLFLLHARALLRYCYQFVAAKLQSSGLKLRPQCVQHLFIYL